MRIFAYIYSNPLIESLPEAIDWGTPIEKIYQDLGQRIALKELFKDCQQEKPNALLIRSLEELGDSLKDITECLNLLKSLNIEIIVKDRDYNLSAIEANLGILLAEIQNKKNRDRLKQGHARNRLKYLPPPGKAPYGYRRGQDRYIIDRSTAPVVKEFFERFLLFGSLRGAVRYLEKRYGKKISPSTGKNWLTNPVYRGNLCYQNGEIIANTHSAIISQEEAAQIDRLLRRNSRLPSRTASAPRSLAGLTICQKCRSPMTVNRVTTKQKKQEYLYLRPINCQQEQKCKAINYQEILDKTILNICEQLPQAVAEINLPNPETIKQIIQDKIDRQLTILNELNKLTETGILDEETSAIRSYKLRTEIATLETQLAQLPPVNLRDIAKTVSLRQFWLDLSESERRFYFREFIKQIEIIKEEKVSDRDSGFDLKLVFIF